MDPPERCRCLPPWARGTRPRGGGQVALDPEDMVPHSRARHQDGIPLFEAIRRLKVPPPTLRKRTHRARRVLCFCLFRHGDTCYTRTCCARRQPGVGRAGWDCESVALLGQRCCEQAHATRAPLAEAWLARGRLFRCGTGRGWYDFTNNCFDPEARPGQVMINATIRTENKGTLVRMVHAGLKEVRPLEWVLSAAAESQSPEPTHEDQAAERPGAGHSPRSQGAAAEAAEPAAPPAKRPPSSAGSLGSSVGNPASGRASPGGAPHTPRARAAAARARPVGSAGSS
jgi:hypothetical protein